MKDVKIAKAEFTAGAAKPSQIPPALLPEIAFAGRSNVGKSSLLNMMLQRKGLARTSNTPGRTRQINFFNVTLVSGSRGSGEAGTRDVGVVGGPEMAFVDLPGYGYAKVAKTESREWKVLLEAYLRERTTLKAVVVLVDVRRGLEQEEADLVEFLGLRPGLPVFLAATKLDKLARNAQKPALAALQKEAGVKVVGTSAETGAGRDDLWDRILTSCTLSSTE